MTVFHHAKDLPNRLGSGLITGAADDDPSGIATCSQAGAQYGGGLLWTLIITTPLMVAIQTLSARIGWVTGRGLAANMLHFLPRWVAIFLIALMVLANVFNIGADIAAMGEAVQLVAGGSSHLYTILVALLCALVPVWLSFEALVRVFKWLTLTLLAYVAVALSLKVDWAQITHDSFAYLQQSDKDYWMMIVAVLGTTISPYLFFWQAAQEAELRQRSKAHEALASSVLFMREHLARIRIDTNFGMLFSNTISFSIMLAGAAAFHQHGITDIETSKQAALALKPIAGDFTFTIFALGIIGTGMLAVPVLAGSAAYAVADVFSWTSGMDHRYSEARGFYTVLVCATAVGTLLDFTGLDPIKALVWSAILNGVIAVPIMFVMMLIGSKRSILGEGTLEMRHRVMGWIATALMFGAVIAMLMDFFR